jgi:hypothetical protein
MFAPYRRGARNKTARPAEIRWHGAAASGASAKHRAVLDYTTILRGGKRYVQMSPRDAALHRTMIPIIGHIVLDDSRIEENFIRASGPGG